MNEEIKKKKLAQAAAVSDMASQMPEDIKREIAETLEAMRLAQALSVKNGQKN